MIWESDFVDGMGVWTQWERVLLCGYDGSAVNEHLQKVCYLSSIINSTLMAWNS